MGNIKTPYDRVFIKTDEEITLPEKQALVGRLEKFLYAICAFDFDDLPIPQSRIEKFVFALISNEIPDIVPQSRAEKFLLAYLTGDTSDLPEPQSRIELLLNNLVFGIQDISNVETIQSRYELLMAYLVQHKEGSNVDYEYVLYDFSEENYVLYNTAEKPIKSAILKGNTLVNLLTPITFPQTIGDNAYIDFPLNQRTKLNATYTVILDVNLTNSDRGDCYLGFLGGGMWQSNSELYLETSKILLTTTGIDLERYLRIRGKGTIINSVIVLEGDYTNVDIPYFEGMQSVKMPVLTTVGKNLFDKNRVVPGRLDSGQLGYTNDSTVTILEDGFEVVSMLNYRGCVVEKIKINESSDYYFSYNINPLTDGFSVSFQFLDKDYNYISRTDIFESTSIVSTPPDAAYVSIWFHTDLSINIPITLRNIQLEEGSIATEYEPYKSTTVTCNEEVELRGIDDVKDELDLVTGEVIQRTIQLPLNGNYFDFKRVESSDQTNTIRWQLLFKDVSIANSIKVNSNGECNIMGYHTGGSLDIECIFIHPSAIPNRLQIKQLRTDTRFTTSEELESFLLENQAYVVLELATESVKTIDISTVDQDGNNTELSTFEDITHVTVTSEGILPDVELSVAKYYPYLTFLLESVSMDTLYNTKELPIKSAVLKGNTLVNHVSLVERNLSAGNSISSDGYITVTANSGYSNAFLGCNAIKESTEYLCVLDIKEYTANSTFRLTSNHTTSIFNKKETIPQGSTGIHKFIFTTISDTDAAIYSFRSYLSSEATSGYIIYRVMLIEYQEGMENWDIPYFEGMQSVQMPVLTTVGKNLFDGKLEYGLISGENGLLYDSTTFVRSQNFIPINCEKVTYTIFNEQCGLALYFYDENKQFISHLSRTTTSSTETVPSNAKFMKIRTYKISSDTTSVTTNLQTHIQIEEGSITTSYEPYKSNILTCNEDIELRGIGDVKDELDLVTGELTQRIGEVIFDGSEDESYTVNNSSETGLFTCFEIISMKDKIQSVDETVTDDLLSDKVSSISHHNYLKDVEGFHNKTWTSTGASRLFLNLPNEKTNGTVEGLRVYLNSNPITLQYPLAEKVIKTVDISVVDQNGNSTKLSSFEDITHVTVTSEGILPDVELSVANQFEEDLTTLSLRMNNIATTQEGLEESVDEQTMEVDSTMMATTEIYEGLL